MQGLLEARAELRPLLLKSNDRLKDLLFLDLALDSTVRTAIERGYEELSNAKTEVFNSCDLSLVMGVQLIGKLEELSPVHPFVPQKIMYYITLAVENLALSSDNNEDLIYCLKVIPMPTKWIFF